MTDTDSGGRPVDREPPRPGEPVRRPEPVLLVLDYPGRRDESRVCDLGLESVGYDVRYLLTPPFVHQVTAPAYAAELLARHGPFGPEVSAVLAYCMAAPIAQEVVAALDGEPPALVLFDGEPATPAAVNEQYAVSAAQLGAGRAEAFDAVSLCTRPGECVERMRRNLAELAGRALSEDADEDADEDAADAARQMSEFYLDWLVHLVAALNASWPSWNGDVLHVVSRDHAFTGSWPGARSTTVRRVDSGRDALLSHPDTRELVLSGLQPATEIA